MGWLPPSHQKKTFNNTFEPSFEVFLQFHPPVFVPFEIKYRWCENLLSFTFIWILSSCYIWQVILISCCIWWLMEVLSPHWPCQAPTRQIWGSWAHFQKPKNCWNSIIWEIYIKVSFFPLLFVSPSNRRHSRKVLRWFPNIFDQHGKKERFPAQCELCWSKSAKAPQNCVIKAGDWDWVKIEVLTKFPIFSLIHSPLVASELYFFGQLWLNISWYRVKHIGL